MTYKEVGSVDDDTILMLEEISDSGEWTHWSEDRDYYTYHVTPELVFEILPVFRPIQQFFLKIPPQGFVHPHVDRRKGVTYHIPVTTNDYSFCYCHTSHGTESYQLAVGKIYEVDRSILHSSKNLGDSDRIHLLVETEIGHGKN